MCDVLLPPGVNPNAVKYRYHIKHMHGQKNIRKNNTFNKYFFLLGHLAVLSSQWYGVFIKMGLTVFGAKV
jgi:hypothetical protein